MNNSLSIILKGFAMGIAEVIPGVSGGTIAFITGIYERLINCIKSFGPDALKAFKNDGVAGFWKAIDGTFLVMLLGGMASGLIGGAFGVTHLLEHYPEPLWGFFFGLILISAWIIGKQVDKWDIAKIGFFVLGLVVAYFITTISPSEGSLSPVYVFLSGMLAISALMLPGVSGSFILLIMGMYTLIVPMIKNFDSSNLTTIAIFAAGCLVGLVSFSRILSYLFKNYQNTTLALLTGFLIGSLNKVWPWRNVSSIIDKTSGRITEITKSNFDHSLLTEQVKIIKENVVLPTDYYMGSPKTMVTIVCMLAGIVLIYLMEKTQHKTK